MKQVTTIGIDLAKRSFRVRRARADGSVARGAEKAYAALRGSWSGEAA